MTKRRALPPPPVETMTAEAMKRTDVAGWLVALQTLADQGDHDACRQLTMAYDEVDVWHKLTGLATATQLRFLDLMTKPDQLFTRKVLLRDMNRQRDALLGPDPTPTERILVERVVACWLACQHAEYTYADRLNGSIPLTEAEFIEKRVERANRSLLRAIKTLATVRKLMMPTMQVNIADQQINVAR